MINIKHDNILNANEDIIAHQVNGRGVMGAGLARSIKINHPSVFEAYKRFVDRSGTPEELLGKNLFVMSDGSELYNYKSGDNAKIISNLFGQAYTNRHVQQTNEKALRSALINLYQHAKRNNFSVAIPYGIGCGLGGGNWNKIFALIQDVFHDHPVTLYKFNG